MSKPDHREQQDLVRERFTRTAEQFAKFSLSKRTAEAEKLAQLAAPRGAEVALDLACGPGTFTRAFAPQVKFIHGLDLTPALLGQAQAAAAQQGLGNITFACGDATALPWADASFDLAVCGYSFHHFFTPLAALIEMARVLRPGGRLAVVDLIVPGDDPAQVAANNAIEIARDASHVHTHAAAELRALVEAAGFRIVQAKEDERVRSFDDWMQIAGWSRGDAAYAATRRRMEASIAGDTAAFHPRALASGDLEFVQTSLFVVAEK